MKLLLYLNLVLIACTFPSSQINRLKSNNYIDKAINYLKKGQKDLATTSVAMAEYYDYTNPAVLDAKGCLAFATGDHGLAENYFNNVIIQYPEYIRAYYNLAQIKLFQGNSLLAQDIMRKIVLEEPDNIEYREFYIGLLKINDTDPEIINRQNNFLKVIKSG